MNDKVFEVERKRQLPDGAAEWLLDALDAAGWQEQDVQSETDTYYSRPDVDFLETVECLRVRRRDDYQEITYKPASSAVTHSADGVISKPETNVVLADGQDVQAEQLLACLGMRLLVRVSKFRARWLNPELPDVTVALDTVPGVGVFIETEAMSADGAGAAALVERVEKELGLDTLPIVDLPYRDLALRATAA